MEYLRTLKPIFTVTQHWPPVSRIQARYCSRLASAVDTVREKKKTVDKFKSRLSSGPSFQDFVKGLPANRSRAADEEPSEKHDYLSEGLLMGNSRKGRWKPFVYLALNACGDAKGVLWLIVAVYFETYGCQMNVNDTEIAWSILQKKGYQRTAHLSEVQLTSGFILWF